MYRRGGFWRTSVVGFDFGLLWVCFVVAVFVLFYYRKYIILL